MLVVVMLVLMVMLVFMMMLMGFVMMLMGFVMMPMRATLTMMMFMKMCHIFTNFGAKIRHILCNLVANYL